MPAARRAESADDIRTEVKEKNQQGTNDQKGDSASEKRVVRGCVRRRRAVSHNQGFGKRTVLELRSRY